MDKMQGEQFKPFQTPEEELTYLRSRVAEQEKQNESSEKLVERPSVIKDEIKKYAEHPTESVLPEHRRLPQEEVVGIVLKLSPEPHDSKMAELLAILQEKGLKNVLAVVKAFNNPHIEDDFHRFLVEYIKEGNPVTGLKEKTPVARSLHMTLYEVILPSEEADQQKTFKELISSMEQFYAGMFSIPDKANRGQNYFSIELAIPNVGEEFIFYASVPVDKQNMFEKHMLSIFHNARITEQKDDYNIFNEMGVSVASYATSGGNPIFPIKTYDEFDHDPLNVILNSFSKIDKEGEGAAIQVIFSPAGSDALIKKYSEALKQIEKGTPVKEAINISYTIGHEIWKGIKSAFKSSKKKDDKDKTPPIIDQTVVEFIKKKTSSPVMSINMRLIASSRTQEEATAILNDVESAFNQFENTRGNKLKFKRLKGGKLNKFLKDFSFREFNPSISMPLNISELTTLMHFHTSAVKGASQLKQSKAGSAPAPIGLPSSGVVLGVNRYRGEENVARISAEDRLRHFYVIGQTGTGKSTMLKNMIIQDIQNGDGVCMIDPHGVDINDVLASVPPERYDDVLYFDPSHVERPMALNMLEYDQNFPEQKTFVVNELFSIFQKLYGAVPESMGPMFEQYFRNATMLVIEDPETGCTLLDVSRVLADKAYRTLKLSKCKNPVIVQFWREVAEKAGGEGALANIVPYITSKFDVFLANDIMRPVVSQEKSVFDFRKIMDEKKILLVNLSKGRLGDINANLIGLIIVGKILMAALSRVNDLGKNLPNFYLYIDEFQNVTTNSISTILSEARKYKLGMTVAHQFIAQLEEGIKDSVFGNVGSMAVFRVGNDDAEYLENQFAPVFTAKDLMDVDNRNAYIKLLVSGRPVKPFNIEIPPPPQGDPVKVEKLKKLSFLTYGRDRHEVDEYIASKYAKPAPVTTPPRTL